MDYSQAVILSIVEGLTEFLPVSSTGHLVLTSKFLNISQTEFVKSFEIIIQLGAILAVVCLYFKKLTTSLSLWPKLIVAFLPSAVFGLIFYSFIKSTLIGNTLVTLFALFFGGIALIFLEKIYKEEAHHLEDIDKISTKTALLVGFCQAFSMIPGVSRAAATIIGGMFLGLKRKTAVEFSFLLAVPTMAAATALDLVKSDFNFSSDELGILTVGLLGSFITAILAIKFLLKFVQNYTFIPFGIYRIILSILFFLFVL